MYPGLLTFLREKLQFFFLVAIMLLSGMYGGPLVYGVIPIILLLLRARGMYMEILLGFFLMLTLSDSRQPVFHFAVNLKDIYILLMGIMLLVGRRAFQPTDRLFMRYLPFLLMALFCLIFSPVVLTSAQKTLSYFLLLVVVPNFMIRSWRDHGDKALTGLIWWGTMILLAGLALKFILPLFVTLEGRFSGLLGNPNGLGLFCLIFFILFTIIGDMRKGLFTGWEIWTIRTIIIASILYSGSRNAFLTVFIFLLFRSFYKMSPFLGFILLLVLIVSYQLILSNFDSIVIALNLQDYFRLDTLDTGSGRIIAWNFGWEWIQKSPIIGNGIGFTDDLYHRYYEILSMMGHQGNAHNSYITFWLDTGIGGVLFYLGATFVNFFKGSSRVRSALPAMYAILFSAFFESWLTASLNPFTIQFVIVMTLIASPVFYEERLPEEPEQEVLPEEKPVVPAW